MGGTGSYIEWDDISDVDGPCKLDFRFAVGSGDDPRSCEVTINGELVEVASFHPTISWDDWEHLEFETLCPPGTNVVRLTVSGSNGGPNIDRLVVSPVASTPAPAASTPAPVASTPAPVASTPAPVASTPAPVASTPAPVASTPAPVASTPAPVASTPAPVASTPAPVASTQAPIACADKRGAWTIDDTFRNWCTWAAKASTA
eukprot:CAMPEP_0203715444 /NCGR_PEP_ID=MMETSP0092-20131115/248_1 /ASSEMBLY_ACC=CAM_ASM_001090 /TAXON_ID=426623 /ORGANISM="Chaetoceros affinis, Strain CCMP159" /LENGTH=202 /DNA_ID=CAMNT_0050593631 /DNA_START=169 /DNA_END=773 /DNA_ORIENTATION=-